MFNYEESFLKNVEFSNIDDKFIGGYVYKEENKGAEFNGGSRPSDVTVPVGLVVNHTDDNMKSHVGEYIGVIGMDRINEFLNLNYKPLKNVTRKFTNAVTPNRTKKYKSR